MKDKGRNKDMKIGIANDHSAVDMKNEIAEYLKSLGQILMKAAIIRSLVKRLVMQWRAVK